MIACFIRFVTLNVLMTISGITIKHFAYCPQIVRIESMGFTERVSEAMIEGEQVEKDKVMNFLYATLKPLNVVGKPIFRYGDLIGSPDYVLIYPNHWVPLDVKSGRKRYDHKLQMKYYLYLMDMNGINVKEGLLYYVSLKEMVRLEYNYAEKRYVEKVLSKIREAINGKVRVVQDARKCYNCGFFVYCKPKIKGNLAYVD